MTARWNSECISCMMGKYLSDFPQEASEQDRLAYMNRVMSILSSARPEEGAPVITDYILELQKEMFGKETDYTEIKQTFNQLMLEQEDRIRSDIRRAPDPIRRAIQYVMTGNYIDFGTLSDVNSEKLLELLSGADRQEIDEEILRRLNTDLQSAKRLVYLTDNCGEIVLDKLLIQAIQSQFPHLDVTIIVRGRQALNDATMEDAVQVGLPAIASVTGNGSGITGTYLPKISVEAARIIYGADVLISKGQGNFETLRGCGLNIYYIFLCKCRLFTRRFQKNLFEGILTNESYC